MEVNNIKEFLEARNCGEESFERARRNTYKHTNCGAWLDSDIWGVTVGSIVEGCDYGTIGHELCYPFEIKEFWDALDEVEREAEQIWNDTHGCEDCGMGGAINIHCETCCGEGVIL